jgi:hypothetical protein
MAAVSKKGLRNIPVVVYLPVFRSYIPGLSSNLTNRHIPYFSSYCFEKRVGMYEEGLMRKVHSTPIVHQESITAF